MDCLESAILEKPSKRIKTDAEKLAVFREYVNEGIFFTPANISAWFNVDTEKAYSIMRKYNPGSFHQRKREYISAQLKSGTPIYQIAKNVGTDFTSVRDFAYSSGLKEINLCQPILSEVEIEALKRDRPRDRQLIELAMSGNFSEHQIAEKIGISHTEVANRMFNIGIHSTWKSRREEEKIGYSKLNKAEILFPLLLKRKQELMTQLSQTEKRSLKYAIEIYRPSNSALSAHDYFSIIKPYLERKGRISFKELEDITGFNYDTCSNVLRRAGLARKLRYIRHSKPKAINRLFSSILKLFR